MISTKCQEALNGNQCIQWSGTSYVPPNLYMYIYIHTFALHGIIYNLNSDVIDICTDVSILNIFTPFSSLKYFPDISSLCYWIFYDIYEWLIFLDKMFPIPTEILCIQISMIIYLFIYLILSHLCKHKHYGHWLLVMGFFFFFFFCFTLLEYIFISENGWKKNPNPKFRTKNILWHLKVNK
jgi:hypothetical protein